MSNPLARTRYRVGQHWRFRDAPPGARDVLLIADVEDHPTHGIVCNVRFAFVAPLETSPGAFCTGGGYWVTQAALDRSVTDLVAPPPPRDGPPAEFRRGPDFWEGGLITADPNRSVAEHLAWLNDRFRRDRERLAAAADPERTWEAAVAVYDDLAEDGDDFAPQFRELCRLLADEPSLAGFRVQAWESCLEISRPGDDSRRLQVISELDEIRYCEEELGETPDDLAPDGWRVERRGVVVGEDGGHVDQALDSWRCRGGPADAARLVLSVLSRVDQ